MKILILGHNGMLGHMVHKYFNSMNISVDTIDYRWPSIEFKNYIESFDGDFIINCIGSIPQKTKHFTVNTELPIYLDNQAHAKIIHAGTDCEMDEDDYGQSKKEASDYIKSYGIKTKILKTSIIGPELNSHVSLFDWFINSKTDVYGYTNAMWNGITTYEWSKRCLDLMNNWDKYNIETILYSECISKYELLDKIKLVFNKKVNILTKNEGTYKCLIGDIKVPSIYIQLNELKKYYYYENKI